MKIFTADWLLPVSSEAIVNGAVLIEGDRIFAVGALDSLTENFPDLPIENFGAAVILPGFVNCHSHLEITAMRGFLDDAEEDFYAWLMKLTVTRREKLDDSDIETAAIFGALEAARAGVTCLGDIGRFGKAGFQALKTNGLRGIVFQETDFSPKNEEAESDFAKLRDKFLELKATETEPIKIGISPHSPYTVSRRLFEKITDYAIAENVNISVHAAESREEQDFFQSGTGFFAGVYKKSNVEWNSPGVSPIEYLENIGVLRAKPLLAHCVRVSDRDIELIAETDSAIAHCPKSNAKFGHGAAPLEKFLAKKIRVGFGSDSVASNNTCDILEESRFATLFARNSAAKKRFLPPREIIETATLGAARALGLDREIGTLDVGKQADLIVVALDNVAQIPVHDVYSALLFASNARDVKMTMVAGREVYRDGQSKMIDEAEIKSKMKSIAEKMKI